MLASIEPPGLVTPAYVRYPEASTPAAWPVKVPSNRNTSRKAPRLFGRRAWAHGASISAIVTPSATPSSVPLKMSLPWTMNSHLLVPTGLGTSVSNEHYGLEGALRVHLL